MSVLDLSSHHVALQISAFSLTVPAMVVAPIPEGPVGRPSPHAAAIARITRHDPMIRRRRAVRTWPPLTEPDSCVSIVVTMCCNGHTTASPGVKPYDNNDLTRISHPASR